MIDFALARRMMVDGQVRTSDVTDLRIIAAFQSVRANVSCPPSKTALAYLDLDVPVADGAGSEQVRRMLKPMVLAKLIQAAAVKPDDRVLDVGCATGYSAAILARLAGSVVALEQEAVLAGERVRCLQASARATRRSYRAADRRLASGCPLRRGFREWRNREYATDAVPPAQGRRPPRGRGGPRTHGPGHALLFSPGRRKWPADLRCRRPAAAGLCGETSVRILDGSFRQPFHSRGVARKTQGPFFFRMAKRGTFAGLTKIQRGDRLRKVRCGDRRYPAGCACEMVGSGRSKSVNAE